MWILIGKSELGPSSVFITNSPSYAAAGVCEQQGPPYPWVLPHYTVHDTVHNETHF